MKPAIKVPVILTAAGLFLAAWTWLVPVRALPEYLPPETPPSVSAIPSFESAWVSNEETNEAHSASVAIVAGQPMAVWYGGTEEGHRDVALYISAFNEPGGWTIPRRVTDRAMTEAQTGRYIRKVGNPVLHAWPDGRLGLYYVSVSIGGWAASSINYMESTDAGETWTAARRLVTSPFLNLSTLVRANGLPLTGNSLQLPVYHEFAGKFSETLYLSADNTVLDKVRLSRGKHSLQPTIANTDELSAVAMLRYSGDPSGEVLGLYTEDAGAHWSKPVATGLPNPDSAVALLNPGDGNLLLVLNDLADGRHRLSLARRTRDGWAVTRTIEDENADADPEYEFSYPSLAIDPRGYIHLVYTWNQKRIKHLRFNRAWLDLDDNALHH